MVPWGNHNPSEVLVVVPVTFLPRDCPLIRIILEKNNNKHGVTKMDGTPFISLIYGMG